MADINRAVDVADEAVTATPHDHSRRYMVLHTLANRLSSRFLRTRSMNDINRSVDTAEMAVKAERHDHADRAVTLDALGFSLYMRFQRTKAADDLNRSMSAFKQSWESSSSPPSLSIRLAMKVATHYASQPDWKESSAVLESAVYLLLMVSLRSLQHTDKQHLLSQFAGLASMAASTALYAGKTPYDALKLLELGRSVIAGLLLDMRTNVSELEQQHPKLAKRYKFLRDELDSLANLASSLTLLESEHSVINREKRRQDAESQFQPLIDEIRLKEGLTNFLCPPTEDKLRTAANSSPVVIINVSRY